MYNYSQFSLVREGENEALKCKVICANHHLQQRKVPPRAPIPGEAASYLRGKDRRLSCANLSPPSHPGSSSPHVPGDQRWPCRRRCTGCFKKRPKSPCAFPKGAASHNPGCTGHAPLARLSPMSPRLPHRPARFFF